MTRATTLRTLTAGFTFAALAACGGGGSDPNSPDFQAYEERQAVMDQLGESILVLNDMSREQIPVDEAAFLSAAQNLASSAAEMLGTFENQTIVAESRSTPDIWDNWDDFQVRTQALVTASAALAAAAEAGGFAGGRELVAAARDTCGACHRPYRAPEE